AVLAVLVELSGVIAELADVEVLQEWGNLAAQIADVVLAAKGRVSPCDTGQDDIGTVAKGNLPILKLKHHRHDGGRLNDLLAACRVGFAVKQKAVGLCARFNRRQVTVHVAGPPHGANYRLYAHVVSSCVAGRTAPQIALCPWVAFAAVEVET